MKTKIYSLYDKKGEFYLPHFSTQNDAMATRIFCNALVREDSQFYANPRDFDLYRIGEFDDLSGKLEGISPVEIITGTDAHRTVTNESEQSENPIRT